MGIGKIKNRAVFFDRDGVINFSVIRNGKPYPPASLKQLKLIYGLKALLKSLIDRGFLLFVVTNQPDVERGILYKKDVEEIHGFMLKKLPINKIYVCYDDGTKKNTQMRKPKPGMLLIAQKEHDLDLNASYMVGDRWRDIDAGATAGCTTVFIDWGYHEELNQMPDKTVSDLKSGINWILEHDNNNQQMGVHYANL